MDELVKGFKHPEKMEEKGAIIPQFFTEPVPNTFKTTQEGRPIYDEVEFVRHIIPGDRKNQPVQRVDDEVRERWPKEYAAFKAGLDTPLEGTPLKEWPLINRSQVMELGHFHIQTVEQLAAVSDSQLQNLGMGSRELRGQARKFVEVSRDGLSALTKMVAENMRLRDDNDNLTRTVTEQAARIQALEASHVAG